MSVQTLETKEKKASKTHLGCNWFTSPRFRWEMVGLVMCVNVYCQSFYIEGTLWCFWPSPLIFINVLNDNEDSCIWYY